MGRFSCDFAGAFALAMADTSPFRSTTLVDVRGAIVKSSERTQRFYVSPGVGSGGNSVAEFFASKAGIKLVHVPHRGGNTAGSDLLAGHVKMGSITWSTACEHVNAGTLLPIAVSSGDRVPGFPAIPTFKDKGYPDAVTTVWLSLSGQRGMPEDIVAKLNEQMNKALTVPAMRKALDIK